MIKVLRARIKQGYRTMPFPTVDMVLPDRFRGRPALDCAKCRTGCSECVKVCPVSCMEKRESGVAIDLGICIFCGKCEKACPEKAIMFTKDYSLSTAKRGDLIVGNDFETKSQFLDAEIKRLFGRSLKLRQVSAGGCNACEADTNVLNTLAWDLGRFGIQFVASPRHADGILVTGPVTQNMQLALKKTYDAVPAPKIVIAVGACAISGGIYRDRQETNNGVDPMLPVDLYVPGCPPHPATILDGLLRLLGRIKRSSRIYT